MSEFTAHKDTFAFENLPPKSLWPEMDLSKNPLLVYPEKLNCAALLLDKMVEKGHGGRTVFHFPCGKWTYADLLGKANQIARVLVEDYGLVSGNRVLLRGPNSPMLAAAWFGVLKAGGICVTTMPLLRAGEISYIFNKAKVTHAICDVKYKSELEAAQAGSDCVHQISLYGDASEASLETLMEQKPDSFENVDTWADDTALIAFTSGTTGKAKATMHFHRDVMVICDSFPKSTLKPAADDVFCGTPPFAFTFGLGALVLFPMSVGASSLLLEKATPEELIQAIEKYKATICFTSPTGYRSMIEVAKRHDISSLKKCVSAGETLPAATFEAWKAATGIKIIDGIGATEMLHIFISAAGDDIRPGSTGKAITGYEAHVIDETGKPVPHGTPGFLAVRGPTGCRYLEDNERQKEYVKYGWNVTGDTYIQDEDGYFYFQARADDLIISGGYNISGVEVENALLKHPAVKECAVVAAPDELRGNVVKAFVVLRNPGDASDRAVQELQEFVKNEIAPYKYPRAIEFVPALPRTETGKLQRFKLREPR